jgi:hypothetical protein
MNSIKTAIEMHGNRWQNENDSGKAMSKILACWGFFVFGKSKSVGR